MSPDNIEIFARWLDEEEKKRGWTDYRLAKEAGISAAAISRARKGVLPKWEACAAIAEALRLDPVLVFRKAGLLRPAAPEEKAEEGIYKITETYRRVSEDNKREMENYSDYIYEQDKKKKKGK